VVDVRASDALGRLGEDLAARHLQQMGMVILERNYRCRFGELDIIARDGDVLVVCEVKTRSTEAFGSPLAAVSQVKLLRMRRIALAWLKERGLWIRVVRFDIIGILHPPTGRPMLEHLRDVA
jgi:putative endonuclease